jgi:hypothetical protein
MRCMGKFGMHAHRILTKEKSFSLGPTDKSMVAFQQAAQSVANWNDEQRVSLIFSLALGRVLKNCLKSRHGNLGRLVNFLWSDLDLNVFLWFSIKYLDLGTAPSLLCKESTK